VQPQTRGGPGLDELSQPFNEYLRKAYLPFLQWFRKLSLFVRCVYVLRARLVCFERPLVRQGAVMTPAKRSRAEDYEDNEYESLDERDFRSLRAGSSKADAPRTGRSGRFRLRQSQRVPWRDRARSGHERARKLLAEIQGVVNPFRLWCDNKSAIVLMNQQTAGTTRRTKHIPVENTMFRHFGSCDTHLAGLKPRQFGLQGA
jgi:hypothetical protein